MRDISILYIYICIYRNIKISTKPKSTFTNIHYSTTYNDIYTHRCMCNRVIYETSLKKEFPDAKITHKMAMPLTVTVEADGKKGKTM